MKIKLFFALTVLALICAFFSLFCGPQSIPLSALSELSQQQKIILFDIRLPRILLAGICGALLAGSGSVFQGFFRNPLADSGILGISSGATLGAVIFSFFPFAASGFCLHFLSPVTIFAFTGALLTGTLIFAFSIFFKSHSIPLLLLGGTAAGTFLSSLTSILLLFSKKDLHSVFFWTMGSFNSKGWEDFQFFVIPSFIALILLCLCGKSLNILGSGETAAVSLGLDIKKLKLFVLLSGSLAAACSVCAGGIISFVGLICPHLMRRFAKGEHRSLIPLSMISGSILMILSDTAARTVIAPSEIPVGIITSLIGVPFFVVILKKSMNI